MILILSTDSTTTAINKYNNMLTGGSFDNSYMPWTPLSGYSIIKRDDINENITITNNTTPGGILIAGASNTASTSSLYTTIFAGTGNAIDYFNNKILAGENNNFSVGSFNYGLDDSSIIMGGIQNSMSGSYFQPEISTIMNGSGNTINNLISTLDYSDDFKRNTIINGLLNLIVGEIGNSWIGNGSGNTIESIGTGRTKGNFILNGHDNIISSSLKDSSNYNSIIGGYNNLIQDQNNSIVIGSNLTGMTDTTSVNNMFFKNILFSNNYVYSSGTALMTFNHMNKMIGIIKTIGGTFSQDLFVSIQNGNYVGQLIFLIGIPDATAGSAWSTCNIQLNPANVISLQSTIPFVGTAIVLNNIKGTGSPMTQSAINSYAGLGIFIWDGAYWIRADHRGGI